MLNCNLCFYCLPQHADAVNDILASPIYGAPGCIQELEVYDDCAEYQVFNVREDEKLGFEEALKAQKIPYDLWVENAEDSEEIVNSEHLRITAAGDVVFYPRGQDAARRQTIVTSTLLEQYAKGADALTAFLEEIKAVTPRDLRAHQGAD